MLDITKIQSEIQERIKNIQTYLPFYEIYFDSKNDSIVDIPSLCLSVLSMILYEGKLKEKGISFEKIKDHIRLHLRELNDYFIEEDELEVLTRDIIFKLDSIYEFRFIEPKTNKDKTHRISLIKIDIKTLEYHLTPDGVDFFLKTLEYQRASRVEITLLLIQLQLKNNTYTETLELIDSLRISVIQLLDEKIKVIEAISNDSSQGFSIYESYHKRIYEQLDKEKELFSSTMAIVLSSIDNLRNSQAEADKEALTQLSLIGSKLEQVKNFHLRLIKGIIDTSSEYDKIINLKMKSSFSEKFNFESVIDKMMFDVQSLDTIFMTMAPLLNLDVDKQFSIAKIFDHQRLKNTDDEKSEIIEPSELIDYETLDMIVEKRVNSNYVLYMLALSDLLLDKKCVSLSQLKDHIIAHYGIKWIENIDFVPFLTRLNSHSEISVNHKKEIKISDIIKEKNRELSDIETSIKIASDKNPILQSKTLVVETQPDEHVVFSEIIKVTNMTFSLN